MSQHDMHSTLQEPQLLQRQQKMKNKKPYPQKKANIAMENLPFDDLFHIESYWKWWFSSAILAFGSVIYTYCNF